MKPLVVIVPGAFHGANAYTELHDALRAAGYETLQVPLVTAGDDHVDANSSHLDDARAIRSKLLPLLDQGRDAIFLSHSYGCMPATEAIAGQTIEERSARGLQGGVSTYICCAGFAFPAVGKNLSGNEEEPPLMPFHRLKDGLLSLDDSAKPLFFSDVPDDQADAQFSGLLKYQTRKSLTTWPLHIESELKVKKVYVLCEKDKMIPPEFQAMLAQVGGFEQVIRLPSGHSPLLSQPGRILEIIESV